MSAVREREEAPPRPRGVPSVIANRRWVWRTEPFPHVVADNVFTKPMYRRLEAGFQEALDTYFANEPDTFTLKMSADRDTAFAVFTSRGWHDLLARFMGVGATGDVDAGLHHHEGGAKGGHVHNDLNPGFFTGGALQGPVNLPNPQVCSYYHGDVYRPGVVPRATVRAVAMLYFVCNPPWSPGDGGETGLYRYQDDPATRPTAAIPPINNSLVMFECTPHSYHAFISSRNPRNSVIMWLHRPWQEAAQRWGEGAIVRWPRSN